MPILKLILYTIYMIALYILASKNMDYLEIVKNNIYSSTTILFGE